ncbi:hypothetical protein [Roseicella frigidaeris]|uniref:hypothetical protein n=1 Tax=Roseicella frigidaeris TaxID=2230885 RepID=UPI000FDD6984|nr:hypothetical protein [Roseicella frigidaeris]
MPVHRELEADPVGIRSTGPASLMAACQARIIAAAWAERVLPVRCTGDASGGPDVSAHAEFLRAGGARRAPVARAAGAQVA